MVWVRSPVYFYKRNDTFYFSRAVPSDLRHRFNKKKVEVSLRTKSEAKAAKSAAALDPYLRQKSAPEWETELTDIGIPAGLVMTVPDILAHPHIAHRGLLSKFDDVQAVAGPVLVMRTGFQSDGQPVSVDMPPPELGAHNHELLKDLGYDQANIAQLSQEGVI